MVPQRKSVAGKGAPRRSLPLNSVNLIAIPAAAAARFAPDRPYAILGHMNLPYNLRANGSRLLKSLGLLPLLLGGCGALDFDVSQKIPEQKVSGNITSALLGTLVPSPFPLSIDLAQETKARGTGPVKAAGLQSLSFQITNTASSGNVHDFRFVQSVVINIESTKSGTTLTKQKIGDLPNPPGQQTTLNIHTYPDVNLLPYINEGSLITSTATGTVPPNDVTFDGQIVVHVNTL